MTRDNDVEIQPAQGPAEEVLGLDLLLDLPGVTATPAAAEALRRLDAAMAEGHTCIDLAERWQEAPAACESLTAWRKELAACPLVGSPEDHKPLVLAGNLLASRRYWDYECRLAAALEQRAADTGRLAGLRADPHLAADITRLFPPRKQPQRRRGDEEEGTDWQRLAACTALAHGLAVITGGPGTGKTTVAGRVVALAGRHRARNGQPFHTVIAAPTGKAAQRLRESLAATAADLVARGLLDTAEATRLTGHVATLHRLLGDRDLADADLVVVDELSMADAATLVRVLDRIPTDAQVLLLGDPEQLASVDAGHVMVAIARQASLAVEPGVAAWYATCGGAGENLAVAALGTPPLAVAQVHLRKNWRSAASPAVSKLAAAIRADPLQATAVFADPALGPAAGRRDGDVPVWIERRDLAEARAGAIVATIRPWAEAVIAAAGDGPAALLAVHARARLLCTRRRGALGAATLNRHLEEELERAGRILRSADGHYHGRPLLVTRNDYDLQLFNGDIGVVLQTQQGTAAHFPAGDGFRSVPLHRLASTEPVFAMTVHKSQGSQFAHVEFVAPAASDPSAARLLTRELIYTACTRASHSARVWCDPALLAAALGRRIERRTLLADLLARRPDG